MIRSQGPYVVRSFKQDFLPHYLERHHRVNAEVLVDILALSRCSLLLHSYSAVAEASLYLNPSQLSVNLEDPNVKSSAQFETLARNVLEGKR
jgi:hypothetical protein